MIENSGRLQKQQEYDEQADAPNDFVEQRGMSRGEVRKGLHGEPAEEDHEYDDDQERYKAHYSPP